MKCLLPCFTLITFFSCSKQKEQIEKIVFDARQINSRIVYKHTLFPSGKVRTTEMITFMYSNGVLIDSLLSHKNYTYNNKDQIVKIQEDSSIEYRYYDSRDSLISQFSINAFGDTTLIDITKYKANKVFQKTHRRLAVVFNEDDISKTDFRKYDTIYDQNNYDYLSDTLEICYTKNLKNELQSETRTQIRNNRKVKATTYNFIGSQRYVQNVTYYQFSGLNPPDFTMINFSGDTIALGRTFLKNGIRIVSSYFRETESIDYIFYNSKNQLTKMMILNNALREKIECQYLYDPKGNVVEETQFIERILPTQN